MNSPEAKSLPQSIQTLLTLGVQLLAPKKIILFGSRARKDNRENSDFDIAFSGLNQPGQWGRFLAEVTEQPITLHKVDLLVYEDASAEYRKNIDKDGVVLYEL